MARVAKKIIKKRQPDTMAEFQALLDSNKDKMSEGDYLALCNGMKNMFEKEEKKEDTVHMVICKVRTLTHEIDYSPVMGYNIKPIEEQVIMNLTKNHFDQLCDKISKHQMVELPHEINSSKIIIHEGPCGEDECNCDGCDLPRQMDFQRNVMARTYITNIYPREEWENMSDLCRRHGPITGDHTTRWAITHIFDQDN